MGEVVSAGASSLPIVELRRVSKRFFGARALDEVSLAVRRGEIHGLVGENGAGKSTLGKIIAGIIQPDSGAVVVEGREVALRHPRDALALRITTVQQELALVPTRSVVENVYLGAAAARGGFVDERRVRSDFEQLRARLGLDIDPDLRVGALPVAAQQKVEIARAMARDARLLVIDEPTTSLTTDESELLMETLRGLREGGTTIIYVSHFLEEVLALADTVTVLRNGQHVMTGPAAEQTSESLITAMLGASLDVTFPAKRRLEREGRPLIEARGLTRESVIDDVSLSIERGEIVGLAGLVGSGRTEVARAMFGADRLDAGEIVLDGEPVAIGSPRDAIGAGIAMVPESRKDAGLLLDLSLLMNVTLPHLDDVSRGTWVASRREEGRARALLERVGVRPPEPSVLARSLSGGNQQKLLFGKWLFREPRVLIADEPTRGVDVGAKRAIYELISSLAEQGIAILLISSDLEEIVGLSHRVLVMRRGRVIAELEESEITQERVTRAAFGGLAEAEAGGRR